MGRMKRQRRRIESNVNAVGKREKIKRDKLRALQRDVDLELRKK